MIKPSAFRLLSPKSMDDASITDYQVSGLDVHSLFCSKCGTHAFHKGNIEQIGGPFVSVNVACLDDLSAKEMSGLSIKYQDGRNNAWWNEPPADETKHL